MSYTANRMHAASSSNPYLYVGTFPYISCIFQAADRREEPKMTEEPKQMCCAGRGKVTASENPDVYDAGLPIYIGETVCTILTAGLWQLGSFYTVGPKQSLVILHLGRVTHIETRPGIHWAPQFNRDIISINTAESAYNMPILKMVDASGVPIIVSAVLIYKVADGLKALLDVRNVTDYVQSQSQATLKQVMQRYSFQELKTESAQVQDEARSALQERLDTVCTYAFNLQVCTRTCSHAHMTSICRPALK
jgi:hypothetical protein